VATTEKGASVRTRTPRLAEWRAIYGGLAQGDRTLETLTDEPGLELTRREPGDLRSQMKALREDLDRAARYLEL